MIRKLSFLFLTFLFVYTAFSMDPDLAKKELEKKKIPVTPESLFDSAAKGNAQNVGLLLDAGIPITAYDEDNSRTALMLAADAGQLEVVKLLIDRGARVNESDDDSVTALMFASRKGNLEIARVLVEHGAGINDSDDDDNTALMEAVRSGNPELVKLLLEKGADPKAENIDDESALDLAKKKGDKNMVDILKSAKKPVESPATQP